MISSTASAHGIRAGWLATAPRDHLGYAMREYRLFVHRFPQWLALAIGNAASETVRQLILPNLVDECGLRGGSESHLRVLDRCLVSCGIRSQGRAHLSTTIDCERWFFDVARGADTHAALCALGPGTESISWEFLEPMQEGLRRAFADADLEYFDLHSPQVEEEHAEFLEAAIAELEARTDDPDRFQTLTERHTRAALEKHDGLWTGIREALD